MTITKDPIDADAAAEKVVSWLEANMGGTVTSIERQARWRPVWFADVDHNGERLELCVRGDRFDMNLVFPLEHEMILQKMLGDHGIPVAQVHGWIDDPMAYVMDRIPGDNHFDNCTDAERDAVVDDYLHILAKMHALDVEPFAAAGIRRAEQPEESGLVGLRRYEELYRGQKTFPDPFLEFCLGWLHRNPPFSRGRESVIVWDTGQFHHQDGRVLAILDVEIGHIGDPMMDLAAWRQRDTVLGFGNFAKLYDRYGEIAGEPVDLDAIQRHHFMFTLSNQLPYSAALRQPAPDSDLMTNLQWCYETNLFATEALAEILNVELPVVEMPDPRESRAEVVLNHLVRNLRTVQIEDEYLRYKLRTMFRMARHAARIDEIGDAVSEADLDDLHELLEHRPKSWLAGETELEQFVLANADTDRYDEALVTLFHKRNLRAQMLLGPAGSAMAHHHRIQTFSD